MCVNETLPPRVRARWLLMTMRLSNINFAGTARTLVAVGIDSEAFMFFATAAAAPRRTFFSSVAWPDGAAAGLGAGFAGAAWAFGCAAVLVSAFGAGLAGAALVSAFGAGLVG